MYVWREDGRGREGERERGRERGGNFLSCQINIMLLTSGTHENHDGFEPGRRNTDL